jgi:hypothetical protein
MSFAHRLHALASGPLGMLLVAALQAVPATAASTPSSATEMPAASKRPLPCEPPTLGRDKLTVTCAIDAAATQLSVRIKVHLTGSHDDTTASMQVAIGDLPVECDAGSKTSTEGEDGDVTLDCRLTASGRQGTATVLRASARWFHAQYVGLEVDGHRP